MNRFKQARIMSGGKSLDRVASESGISKNTIWKLELDKVDAGYSIVTKLANYYGVNVSWLIGQSDTPVLDEDHQIVTGITGLSENAISNLQRMKAWKLMDAMNAIVETEDFIRVVEQFDASRAILQCNNETLKEGHILDQAYVNSVRDSNGKTSDFALLSKATQADMLMASSSQIFGNLLRSILKEGENNGNS